MWYAVVFIWLLSDLTSPPEKLVYASPYRSEEACRAGLPDVARALADYLKESGADGADLKVELACEAAGR